MATKEQPGTENATSAESTASAKTTSNGKNSQNTPVIKVTSTNPAIRATATQAAINASSFDLETSDPGTFDIETYEVKPTGDWPPPIFLGRNVSPQERYYMEHRWYSQWLFCDAKASESKKRYHRLQWLIGVGAVTVPVLVGIPPTGLPSEVQFTIYALTVIISLSVAIATAIENIYKYGENWRTYRNAAEELQQEKSLFDARAGRYANNPTAFTRFVERVEEIIAQQNGRWVQTHENQQQQSQEMAREFVEKYVEQEEKAAEKTPKG